MYQTEIWLSKVYFQRRKLNTPCKLSTLCESLVCVYSGWTFCTFYGNAPNREKVSNYYFPQSLLSPSNLAKNFV